MITVEEVLEAAFPKSLKNVPGQIADDAVELLGVVARSLGGIFSVAARVNPLFFGVKETVALASGAWPMPTAAEAIFRIEMAGAKVVTVPIDDRAAAVGEPALYFFGQKFYGAGNAGDPSAGDLDFFYSKVPDTPGLVTSELDALWREAYNEFLILETAIYLEIKRGEDAGTLSELKESRDAWARRFIAHLEHAVSNEVRRHSYPNLIVGQSTVPLGSLLAGGDAAI